MHVNLSKENDRRGRYGLYSADWGTEGWDPGAGRQGVGNRKLGVRNSLFLAKHRGHLAWSKAETPRFQRLRRLPEPIL